MTTFFTTRKGRAALAELLENKLFLSLTRLVVGTGYILNLGLGGFYIENEAEIVRINDLLKAGRLPDLTFGHIKAVLMGIEKHKEGDE